MYQALYRKYRPVDFSEVVGQKIIVNTLKNTIIHNHINHAYLFSGPRGTGKTTVAKIFARSVNCLDPVDGMACGKCKNCVYAFSKECMDIIEIDAASNNGVDEIRELRSKVNILTTELSYKVYIIDEVHMLSIGAFNALLKTIEEPPSHVIFILATTDPQKIPATIISRCQWYNFKKITNEDIVNRLKIIVNEENIKIDPLVLLKIAQASDGGLRDAIGLLDKIRAYGLDEIKLDDFYEINGEVNEDEIKKLEELIFSLNIKEVLSSIEIYYQNGKNLVQILKRLLFTIKDELFDYYINNLKLKFDENRMVSFINSLNNSLVDIKKADDVKLSIEIFLLHYIKKHSDETVLKDSIKSSSYVDESNLKNDKKISQEYQNKKESDPVSEKNNNTNDMIKNNFKKFESLMLIRSKNTMTKALKEELVKESNNFLKLDDYTFDQQFGYLACELLDGCIRASSLESLIISYDYDGMIEKLSSHFSELNDFYNKITNSTKKIAFITTSKWSDLKKEYIELKKQGKQFDYQEEPNLNNIDDSVKIVSESNNDVISKTVEMFGDLVEIQ